MKTLLALIVAVAMFAGVSEASACSLPCLPVVVTCCPIIKLPPICIPIPICPPPVIKPCPPPVIKPCPPPICPVHSCCW